MAFNGSGVHNRVHDWTQDLTNTVPVTASRMDAEHDDISAALSNTICRDGQSTTSARIPFASGVSAAAGATSSVAYAQTNGANTGMYFPATDQWGLVAGGTATLTSTATKLTAPVAVDFTGAVAPTSDDGAALGSTSQKWSDLFLASGAVINFNNGNATITHSAGTLTTAVTTFAVSGAATVSGAFTGGTVTGSSGLVATTGGLTVSAGGASITGNTAITGTLNVTSTLTASNGFTVSAGSVSLPASSVADAALAAPGSWKFIATQTASSSASISFDANTHVAAFDGTYDHIMIRLGNVKAATDNVTLDITIGTGAGPTYQSSGYQYALQNGGPGGFGNNLSASNSLIPTNAGNGLGNDAGEQMSGIIDFCNPEATDKMPINIDLRYTTTNGQPVTARGVAHYGTAGAVTGIKFAMSSGNIASGTFAIFGLKKS